MIERRGVRRRRMGRRRRWEAWAEGEEKEEGEACEESQAGQKGQEELSWACIQSGPFQYWASSRACLPARLFQDLERVRIFIEAICISDV